MKVKSALLGLAAASGGLLMSANVASADGYSAPGRAYAPFTWTGCYVGIQGGWAGGESEHISRAPVAVATSNTVPAGQNLTTLGGTFFADTRIAKFNMDGGLIGGTLGCNLQYGGGFVIGVESDMAWIDKSGSGNAVAVEPTTWTSETRERWFSTTRLRLGQSLGNFLIYATGGAAFADAEATVCNTGGAICASESHWRIGVTYGGGGEWAFGGGWSVKAEYLRVDFAKDAYFAPANGTPATPVGLANRSGGVTLNDDVVRLGLNYRFGDRREGPLK